MKTIIVGLSLGNGVTYATIFGRTASVLSGSSLAEVKTRELNHWPNFSVTHNDSTQCFGPQTLLGLYGYRPQHDMKYTAKYMTTMLYAALVAWQHKFADVANLSDYNLSIFVGVPVQDTAIWVAAVDALEEMQSTPVFDVFSSMLPNHNKLTLHIKTVHVLPEILTFLKTQRSFALLDHYVDTAIVVDIGHKNAVFALWDRGDLHHVAKLDLGMDLVYKMVYPLNPKLAEYQYTVSGFNADRILSYLQYIPAVAIQYAKSLHYFPNTVFCLGGALENHALALRPAFAEVFDHAVILDGTYNAQAFYQMGYSLADASDTP